MTANLAPLPTPEDDAAILREEATVWADAALAHCRDADGLVRDYQNKIEALGPLYGTDAVKRALDEALLPAAKRRLGLLADAATMWTLVAGIEPEEVVPETFAENVVSAATIATMEDVKVSYLFEPYLPEGVKIELVARIKVGKTDFATSLAGSIARGTRFCSRPTRQARVLYLSEQSPRVARRYLDRAGLLDCHEFRLLFRADVGKMSWPSLCANVSDYVRDQKVGLVVIDTLTAWSGMTGDDENNSGDAQAVVDQLDQIVASGATVLCLRHARKGGGSIGESARGSSAFGGAMDVLLSLERTPGGGDTRRELQAVSRLDEVPAAVVLERDAAGYSILGEGRQAVRMETERAIFAALPIQRDGALTVEALQQLVPNVGHSMVNDILKESVGTGSVSREKGAGRASAKAYGYWLTPPDLLSSA